MLSPSEADTPASLPSQHPAPRLLHKSICCRSQLCSRVIMLFFRNMSLRMLRFGGGNMLQKPLYATAVVVVLSCSGSGSTAAAVSGSYLVFVLLLLDHFVGRSCGCDTPKEWKTLQSLFMLQQAVVVLRIVLRFRKHSSSGSYLVFVLLLLDHFVGRSS